MIILVMIQISPRLLEQRIMVYLLRSSQALLNIRRKKPNPIRTKSSQNENRMRNNSGQVQSGDNQIDVCSVCIFSKNPCDLINMIDKWVLIFLLRFDQHVWLLQNTLLLRLVSSACSLDISFIERFSVIVLFELKIADLVDLLSPKGYSSTECVMA